MSEVSIKFFMPLKVASLEEKKPRGEVGQAVSRLLQLLSERKTKLAGDAMVVLPEEAQSAVARDANLEICVPISGKVKGVPGLIGKELEKGAFACLTHAGPIEKLPDAYSVIMKWIEENGYRISGSVREVYQKGLDRPGAAEYQVEIQFPVRK